MADFSIVDRRGTPRPPEPTARSPLMPPGVTVRRAKEEAGYTGLPFQNPNRNKSSDERTLAHLRASKLKSTRMSRTGMVNGAAGSGLQMATGRPRDPMWYWKQNNLPFNFMDPNELARIREFCNTPDAPITMWDGSTKPLGAIEQGDVVKGWDYGFTPYPGEANYLSVFSTYTTNGGQQRRYVPSTVLAVNTRTAPVVQVTLASGTRLTCTPDHQWANPLYATVIEANAPYSNTPSADAAREYLPAEVGRNLLSVTEAMQDRIVAIEPAGTSQVISMQTTTGNYVAWGYASKNCRLLYVSHPLIAACTDIFAKFPLQGIHFECKDEELTTFYSDLFLDQLKYEDHLLRLNREYWLVGETFSLGGWNDTLGIWEGDQVINPDNVDVETQLFLDEPRYLMQLPDSLRTILQTRAPRWQYQQLVQAYPELVNFVSQDDRLPVSDVILQHMKFEADTFSNRGIPILMRGMRTIIQEEMLNAALDSIADRLYTPLILTKLGAKASDLGTTVPWIPDIDEMEEFNFALDSALAADFRALTYHWAIDMQPVFGRENVPDLSADFERIDERLLMVWGLSRTMLTGASAGETYAADALNRDVVTQLMSHDQRMLQQFVRSRGEIVAEAREHFDYEVRGGKKYLITEEIFEVDPESGEGKIVEVPKLLVPDLRFKCVALGTEVQTPTGPVAAEDLVVGDLVIAWDEQRGMVERPVLMSQTNGVQPVYEVVTQLGRRIRVTDEHPFSTPNGWVDAQNLTVGMKIQLPVGYIPAVDRRMEPDVARFLGLMTGDGCMRGSGLMISIGDQDPETLDWLQKFLAPYGCHARRKGDSIDYNISKISGIRGAVNPVKTLVTEMGMWGVHGRNKRIPRAVWAAGPEAWAEYLSGYLDADGHVASGRQALVSWTSISNELLLDVQLMLSYLNVRADLVPFEWIEKETQIPRRKWMLNVAARDSLMILQRLLTPQIPRKAALKDRVLTNGTAARRAVSPLMAVEIQEWVSREKVVVLDVMSRYGLSRSVAYRAMRGITAASSWVTGRWDAIKTIELLPAEETWALTVADCHSHVTNGLITHNTLNLADEQVERDFLEALNESGVPVPYKARVQGVGMDFDEMVEQRSAEEVQLVVVQGETDRKKYLALKKAGLPIPDELRQKFDPKAIEMGAQQQPMPGEPSVTPALGQQVLDLPGLAPTQNDIQAAQQDGEEQEAMLPPDVDEDQDGEVDTEELPQEGDDVPPESNEQRKRMPKAAALRRFGIREVTDLHYEAPDDSAEEQLRDRRPSGRFAAPRHLGMRYHLAPYIRKEDTLSGSGTEEPSNTD